MSQSMFPAEAQYEVDKMFTRCYADKSPFVDSEPEEVKVH